MPEQVNLEYRAGTQGDIESMSLVLERAYAAAAGERLPETISDQGTVTRIQERMAKSSAWSFVADAPERMFGFVLGHSSLEEVTLRNTHQSGPEVEHLALLMTEPLYWKNGVGTELLDLSADNAREKGKEQMILWTGRANNRARQLYERRGYKLSSHTRLSRLGNPLVQYVLDL